jgi:hypothetical protein
MILALRCYFDETTGWFKNPFYPYDDWDMENCDQVVRTSIQEEVIPAFTVYPNPMQDYFTIKPVLSDEKPYDLKIIDIHGRQVLEMVSLIGERKVELRGLPGGMYIIQLIKGDEVGFAKVLKD